MATVLPNRSFVANDAKREKVPLLVGLMGPSGGGKTYTALRLATGIQSVSGGDIYVIDTESRRALHYADKFKFKHVPFDAPFGSLDYLAALQWCVKQGAGVVIVDSMSHEHEGPGGMKDLQEQILDRMAGTDYKKRERMQMLAWAEPKAKRRALINGILQLNCNFIFCFRAKNTSKPVKNPETGKNEVQQQGFMPIAGDEFVFEQTLNALLLPGAGGVPTWQSDQVGERTMIKLPEQFASLRQRTEPLDEKVGERLAKWAAGDPTPVPKKSEPAERAFEATDAGTDYSADLEKLKALARPGNMDALGAAWKAIGPEARKALAAELPALKAACEVATDDVPFDAGDNPAAAKTAELLTALTEAPDAAAVSSAAAEFETHREALTDDQQMKIEAALSQARLRFEEEVE